MSKFKVFFLLVAAVLGLSPRAQAEEGALIPASESNASISKHEIHLFIPSIQYRYENHADQTLRNRKYQNFNLAGIIFSRYLVGLELDQFNEESSLGAIHITTKFQEVNLYVGYLIYSRTFNEEYKVAIDLAPVLYIGQNRSTVNTRVGSIETQSIGDNNLNYALGVQTSLRAGFFIVQPEVHYGYSRSYDPSSTVMFGVRVGFRIGL